jgi:hypothetical protein
VEVYGLLEYGNLLLEGVSQLLFIGVAYQLGFYGTHTFEVHQDLFILKEVTLLISIYVD